MDIPKRIENIESILRELIEEGYALIHGVMNKRANIGLRKDSSLYSYLNNYAKILDNCNRKLDSQGKTEKKELCLSHPYRDSGGEQSKPGGVLGQASDSGPNSGDDSKPPEPKIECSELEMAHLTKDEPREDDLYELYLKDGDQYYFKKTTHPFTEYNNMVNLGIGEVIAKREDLQWVIGYLEGWHDIYPKAIDEGEAERVKRIKEEYGIE